MARKLEEIAQELGLSVSTISRVVNNKSSVKPKTRQAVLKALKKYDYSPNLHARSLKTNQTFTVGVVIPDITDPFFGNVIKGINEMANQKRYSVIFCDSDENPQKEEEYLRYLTELRVDGLVVAPVNPHNDFLQKIISQGMPLVFIDNVFPYEGNFDSVAIDNMQAAYEATKYLIKKGHRDIGLIAGKQDEITGLERLKGYMNALNDDNIQCKKDIIQLGDFKETSGYEAMQQLLNSDTHITAVFVTSFQMTYGALRAVREHNLNYGSDIAFMGFDISDHYSFLSPGITSVVQPERAIGRTAAQVLLNRIDNKAVANQKIILDFSIVERGSV